MTIIIPNLLPDEEFLYSNPFNFLPFELLELIFEYLQPEDLKSLLNIQGRLHDVLVASPISMRKLKVILDERWEEKIDFVKENGENVRDLSFQHCNFDDPQQFRDLVRCMRNVETMKLSNVHISAEVFTKKFRKFFIELERVKRFDVDNSQAVGKLLRLYIHDPQVVNLRLDFSHFNVAHEFVRLLWCQMDLKVLELSGFGEIMLRSLFARDISYMIRFELKKLIFNCGILKNENLMKTLEIFSETLEDLEVHKEVEFVEFFNLIFKMPKLKSLTLATNFATLKTFIDAIDGMKKSFHFGIKNLTLVTRSQYGIEQPINFIVEKLKNLENLKVLNLKTNSSDQFLSFVNLKPLKSLEVDNSKLKFLQSIKLENLTTLKLSNIHPFLKFEDYENLFKSTKNLEQLILSNFEVYYVIETIKIEISKITQNLHLLMKTLKHFELFQELRYQKPIKVLMKRDQRGKLLRASDSFIKICREDFHMLRKLDGDFKLVYYADDYFKLNNKYLKD